MEVEALLGEMIGMVSVSGGLCIAGYAIFMGAKERGQRLEIISKERLMLIEKGMDPALAFQKPGKERDGARALLWGLLLAGGGLGLLLGSQLARTLNLDNDTITGASALLFGGIGLVIYYFYKGKNNVRATG